MHGTYAALEKDHKIGPFMLKDGQVVPKPFMEYPKYVRDASGKGHIVQSLNEEIAVVGEQGLATADPLHEERQKLLDAQADLAKQLEEGAKLQADMKAQLAELASAREALAMTGKVPEQAKTFEAEKPAPQAAANVKPGKA